MFSTIYIQSKKKIDFINITGQVEQLLKKDNVSEGICYLFVPHTTAGLTINESADPDVIRDMENKLNKLIPLNDYYLHSEGNSDAHIKTSILGSSLNIIINNSRLLLGTWQGLFFCEFDGPRNRKLHIKTI